MTRAKKGDSICRRVPAVSLHLACLMSSSEDQALFGLFTLPVLGLSGQNRMEFPLPLGTGDLARAKESRGSYAGEHGVAALAGRC
ncbi:uncharacterized protein K460DRAFT_368110 [Cucurbitaria berberidis CBS 394.84]|uniref:Uncharacterized protein n=1 Tax=Cucurbitaria berberidis CBS 394.84 TaxID=1168544 RepID=A0A9P4GCR7_9PLEO|nr:uncharacterized protein K460DRAFT_368110 [Cucurbitaria berberidis CBS 394.84]KAF1843195.1 hypothetical protein K460DRAFT_368110 [Cucurbitaria berberidis CBS 394.84]